MKIDKVFILFLLYYRRAITILKESNEKLFDVLSDIEIFNLRAKDKRFHLLNFFKTFKSFFKLLLNLFISISF